MRVNIEDDLDTSGRLAKFCKRMKWDHDRGLGRLVRFYRATQDAELATASRAEILVATLPRSEDVAEANRVIDAMIYSQLADITDEGKIRIRGNLAHVERIKQIRENAAKGGKAKAAKALANAKQTDSECLAISALLAPNSYIPAAPDLLPNGREGNADSDPRANPAALALEKFYLGNRKGSLLTRLPPAERIAIDELLRAVGNDIEAAKKILQHYLADARDYYDKRKWPISLLVDNIGEHDGSGDAEEGGGLFAFLQEQKAAPRGQ